MIASESLTKSPRNFSTPNATTRSTSEENAPEQTEFDNIFQKTPSDLLKYLLVINNRDSRDRSDVNETNAGERTKKRRNNADESFERARKIVTHGESVLPTAVTNKIKQNSFCNNFYHDKPSLEMGVFSLNCDIAKCSVVSNCQPLPELKHGSMDERCGDECTKTSENDEEIQSRLLSEQVQNFREIFHRNVSSEESTQTDQFSDDDLSLLPEVLPPETLNFILAATEKNLNIESPESVLKDSSSECSEFTDLVPFSGDFPQSVQQLSSVPSTSKDNNPPVKPSTSGKVIKKTGKKKSTKNEKDVEEDEMVLVPYGKSFLYTVLFGNSH